MSLHSQLARWQSAGLLTADQAQRLADHESSRSSGSRWMVWALSGVGALAIVAGLISVIAANWDEIPSGIKLAGGLTFLVLALAGAARLQGWGRDLFLLLHGGLVLANIALVGQIYHLGGAPWRVFAICAAFALPATFVGQRALLTDLFLGYLLTSILTGLDELDLLEPLAERAMGLGFVLASLAVLALTALELLRREEPRFALRRWGFGLLSVATVWSATEWASDPERHGWDQVALTRLDYLPLASFAALGGLATLYLFFKRRDRIGGLAALTGLIFLTFAPISAALPFAARQLLGFGLFAALTIALSFAAAHHHSRRWTNLFTLALAVRIFVLYLELVKDLMSTGLSLLATGVVLCAVAFGWWRFSIHVAPKMEAPR